MSDDIEKSVLAHRYLGGDDIDELTDFVHPALAVQHGNDDVEVTCGKQSFVLHPGDWVVEVAPGLLERLTDAAFQGQFRKIRA